MWLFEKIKETVKEGTELLKRGVATVVDCTIELCREVAEATVEAVDWIEEKVSAWIKPGPPKTFAATPIIEETFTPQIEIMSNAVNEVFPQGIQEASKNMSPDQRVEKLAELTNTIATTIGLSEEIPEIAFFVPENQRDFFKSCGEYDFVTNTIRLNLAMIANERPKRYEEQVYTIIHELHHALQYKAISAWAEGGNYKQYGIPEGLIAEWAKNLSDDNYIKPTENMRDYFFQPVEQSAFWIESKVRRAVYNKNKK